MAKKEVLTTWEAGRYCGVSPYTVRNWIEGGILEAYATPGGHRRVRREHLDAFLASHDMPLPEEFRGGERRVLLLLRRPQNLGREMAAWSEDLAVRQVASGFEAGFALPEYDPHLFMLDFDDPGWDAAAICRAVRATPSTARLRIAAFVRGQTVDTARSVERAGALAQILLPPIRREILAFLKRTFPACRWGEAAQALRQPASKTSR